MNHPSKVMLQNPDIPLELTSFIGRKRELADLTRLLGSARLLVITGTAGCGKTRLALRVASQAGSRYADGVCWVELAPLADAQLVPRSVAKTLQVTEQPGRRLVEGILDALAGRQILLVLDNCEHVLAACAELLESLMKLPGLHVLMTSREAPGMPGEVLYPLAPMALPPANLPLEVTSQIDAVQLFVERARAILPDFALTPANEASVCRICRRLDGIPLAIELASARINALTLEQIEARLKDRIDFLDQTSRKTANRHRTLRVALDWSYDLLSGPEQVLLRRLAVLVGGCSLAIAETVCSGDEVERRQVLDLLAALISKSLVVAQTLLRVEARYALLETIRQYAQEKLIASGEWPLVQDRLLGCFLQLTEETAPKLNGPDQQQWLDWLESELENIRAALAWSLESDQIEAGLRIALGLYQFWTIRDYVEEGLGWLERLIARADEGIPAGLRANGLAYAAFLASFRGKTLAQRKYGQAAADLTGAPGEDGQQALRWALAAQAYGAHAAQDFATEYDLGQRVIQLDREAGDLHQLGFSLSVYSLPAMALEKYAAAGAMLDESLALQRAAGNPYRIAIALNLSGDLARCQGSYLPARACYEESIAFLRQIGGVRDLASVLYNLGHTCLHLGDVRQAASLFSESLSLQRAQGNRPGMAECLIGFAALAAAGGMADAGGRLLAAAVEIGGQRIATIWAATRREYESVLALVRTRLTEQEFHAEQTLGSAYTLEQAIEYAQSLPLKEQPAPLDITKPDSLTGREIEVANLIAEGKSNAEIAAELVVSKRTVEKHIAHIRSKLGFSQRAQIVRWVLNSRQAP